MRGASLRRVRSALDAIRSLSHGSPAERTMLAPKNLLLQCRFKSATTDGKEPKPVPAVVMEKKTGEPSEPVLCYCGQTALLKVTSNRAKAPGLRYLTCKNSVAWFQLSRMSEEERQEQRCAFFSWLDPPPEESMKRRSYRKCVTKTVATGTVESEVEAQSPEKKASPAKPSSRAKRASTAGESAETPSRAKKPAESDETPKKPAESAETPSKAKKTTASAETPSGANKTAECPASRAKKTSTAAESSAKEEQKPNAAARPKKTAATKKTEDESTTGTKPNVKAATKKTEDASTTTTTSAAGRKGKVNPATEDQSMAATKAKVKKTSNTKLKPE